MLPLVFHFRIYARRSGPQLYHGSYASFASLAVDKKDVGPHFWRLMRISLDFMSNLMGSLSRLNVPIRVYGSTRINRSWIRDWYGWRIPFFITFDPRSKLFGSNKLNVTTYTLYCPRIIFMGRDFSFQETLENAHTKSDSVIFKKSFFMPLICYIFSFNSSAILIYRWIPYLIILVAINSLRTKYIIFQFLDPV